MAEVKLIHCGPEYRDTSSISYTYANERGDKVEIIVWGGRDGKVWLYPVGVEKSGRAVVGGHECAGLLSAQIEAVELLSHD